MKEKILHTANELFLNYGFKSITMDEIARHLSISKKTIYTFYKTKTELVEACVYAMFDQISSGIDTICALKKNPIEELFDIKEFVVENLKGEKSSPQYQLKKYYPSLFYTLQKKQFDLMQDCVLENLERGIETGYFRKEINIDFISRIYFVGVISVKDIELFPMAEKNMKTLMNHYLNYHIRAVATAKGVKKLEALLAKEN
ncbi:MAG TPA: TetR/AcrR family transcriptional regulator [Flavobacteriia bacterium]|jgi:AcrR family transcriptional regulator|nr:TetR/AcrR family transcriptional regulator [Flavobacteriia bacterium]